MLCHLCYRVQITKLIVILILNLQAIWLLCTGAREAAFRNIKTIAECLADELINAAKVGILSNVQDVKKPLHPDF